MKQARGEVSISFCRLEDLQREGPFAPIFRESRDRKRRVDWLGNSPTFSFLPTHDYVIPLSSAGCCPAKRLAEPRPSSRGLARLCAGHNENSAQAVDRLRRVRTKTGRGLRSGRS
jgi:hypothetical protein